MDMIPYRLEQVEKRYDAMDARMGRVEERLGEIKVTIAGLATKESVEALKDSLTRAMTEQREAVALSLAANKDSIEKSFEEFKNSVRNWGIGLAAIIITAILGVGALMTQASNNQLAAFEAGLSAIQAVAAAHSLPAAPAPK